MNIVSLRCRESRLPVSPVGLDRTRSRNHLEVMPSVADKRPDRPAPATGIRVDGGAVATAILFGSFCLFPVRRLLLEGDQPVRIGSRALEILIALVEHHGELLSKNALMERVWPDTTVVEANLSVHIAALRKALRDGSGENRYLVNMPGRGYRFVAPITLAEDREPSTLQAAAAQPLYDLPQQLTPLIGRNDSIQELTEQLQGFQLLTVAGPEDVEKSAATLALAEGHADAHEPGVWLVDLAQLTDPRQLPYPVAAAPGLDNHPKRPLSDFLIELKHMRTLLVLNNCNVQIIHILHRAQA
jgi:DNA-binding winged helix-turn-helix (wHTH) protein